MRKLIYLFLIIFSFQSFSQELSCEVVVNAQLTGNENVQIFKTLERQLTEFVNNTSWTDKTYKPQERINCSMVVNITDYNNDNFQASIQVQSSRSAVSQTGRMLLEATPDQDYQARSKQP